jgi:hypothetical protein
VTDKFVSQQQRKDKELLRGSEVLLLVDDEEMILEIGKDLLEKLGYQVITALKGSRFKAPGTMLTGLCFLSHTPYPMRHALCAMLFSAHQPRIKYS